MQAKVIKIRGKQITLELEERPNLQALMKLASGQPLTAAVTINDNRKITQAQRAKIYALLADLERWSGMEVAYFKEYFKQQVQVLEGLESFSLSNCSIDTAKLYILAVLNFMFEQDVPFRWKLWDSLPDEYPKQALCLKNKVCVICGKTHADIAHYDAVGSGRNRNKINHTGLRVMTLCRAHHTEQHKIGLLAFVKKYHIKPVKLTPDLVKRYHLGRYKGDNEHD